MKRILTIIGTFFLFLFALAAPLSAADLRIGETITVDEADSGLSNLYFFGEKITVDAPVENDVVAAGGNIFINSAITGGVLAAGGNIDIKGTVGNSIRAAGGNITVESTVEKDLVLTGGNIRLTKNAKVNGDLIVTGGSIDIESPIVGKVVIKGGDVTINSVIGGSVDAAVGRLTIGRNAVITSNLTYESPEKATITQGSTITGRVDYKQIEPTQRQVQERWDKFITAFSVYTLVSNILFGLVLLWLLKRFIGDVFDHITSSPVGTGLTGFISFFVIPLISLFLLIFILPGIAGFLFYFLLFVLSGIIGSLYLGYLVMRWWNRRSNKVYYLNWTIAVIGPILYFLLSRIPLLGWLATAILFFLAMGGIIRALLRVRESQNITPAVVPVKTTPRRIAAKRTSRPARRKK